MFLCCAEKRSPRIVCGLFEGSTIVSTKRTWYLPPLLFSATLFISAGLLFWIQPLIAKTLLPLLGGAPAVWNTCLLFFQTMLLLGYVYALASSRWLSLRAQAVVHVVLISLIGIYVFRSPVLTPVMSVSQQTSPTRWLLANLLVSIGPPFFIISASNPLLQGWFSRLRHYLSVDPYFLFAASNAGSLIALLAFPLVLEPALGLNQHMRPRHLMGMQPDIVRPGLLSDEIVVLQIAFAHPDAKSLRGFKAHGPGGRFFAPFFGSFQRF